MKYILVVYLAVISCVESEESAHTLFPKGFIFGAATSSYQIEGAWNESGKGVNIWDTFTHDHPSSIKGNIKNGDVADDSYHQYKLDVQHLKEIGFKLYRFSLSWSRIFPNGTDDYVNPTGVQYYHNVLDELLANKIEPMITIIHSDLPQPMQDIGGWLNRKVVDYFLDFAEFAFKTYGSKVKWWVTINEPKNVAPNYGSASSGAPGIGLHGYGEYISGHNMILAHGRAHRLYHEKYAVEGGKVSMAFSGRNCIPKNSSDPEDIAAAERCFQFTHGWFIHPLMIGDYPPIMRQLVDENSRKEGLEYSRLPHFTSVEIEMLNGTLDYVASNVYTSALVTTGHEGENPSFTYDSNVISSVDSSWIQSAGHSYYAPGMREIMKKIKDNYNNPIIVITENGFGTNGGLDDHIRITAYETYMAELRDAIYKDGCNVIGHVAWSLMDNFEWLQGSSLKFGLYEVDWNSTMRTRTMKKSGLWYKHYIAMHNLV